jgi:hypothetical protein
MSIIVEISKHHINGVEEHHEEKVKWDNKRSKRQFSGIRADYRDDYHDHGGLPAGGGQ